MAALAADQVGGMATTCGGTRSEVRKATLARASSGGVAPGAGVQRAAPCFR